MGEETRLRIIAAAERLFARRGVERTSLRAVTREAGVNVAAIHYHFGCRDDLLRAVLDRIIEPLNARREVLLDSALAAAGGRPLAVEEILAAFLRPDLEAIDALRGRGVEIAHFIARTYASPSPGLDPFVEAQFRNTAERFVPELERSLPRVSRDEIRFRLRCTVGVVVALFGAAGPPESGGALEAGGIDRTLDRLVSLLAPGFAAPPP